MKSNGSIKMCYIVYMNNEIEWFHKKMCYTVYINSGTLERNIIGVPRKTRKFICWGTFLICLYSMLYDRTGNLGCCTPKIKKNYISGYIYNLYIQCVARLHVENYKTYPEN